MAQVLIRKGADGFELNFGPLVVAELNGIRFAIQDWRAKQLGLTFVEEEIPEFFDDLKLEMQYAVAQISAFPFSKADIKPLGKALSELDALGGTPERVDVHHKARILMMWKQGEVISEQKAIDHFYSGMTEEEIEHSRF